MFLLLLLLFLSCFCGHNVSIPFSWRDLTLPLDRKICLNSHAFSSYCEVINSPLDLYREVKKSLDVNHKRFHIVTSVTNSIVPYAAYAVAINTVFALSRNYSIEIHNEDDERDINTFDPDSRWNKIKFLIDLLEKGESKQTEWFIWLDADLAVVDFPLLKIDEMIHHFADVDIFMSKDKNTTSFIANSGFILVRNSEWSLAFLRLWWNTYDRKTCCDQNALTWLYQKRIPVDVTEKMFFLDSDIINTNFPSWENHHEYCPVLHLAGLTSLYRRNVLREGFEVLCNYLHENSCEVEFPLQLSLTKSFLQECLIKLNSERNQELKLISVDIFSQNSVLDSADKIMLVKTRIDDIMKFEDDEVYWVRFYYERFGLNYSQEMELQKNINSYLVDIRSLLFYSLFNQTDSSKILHYCPSIPSVLLTVDVVCLQYLRLLQNIVTFGFESLVSMKQIGLSDNRDMVIQLRTVLTKIAEVINRVLVTVSTADIQKQFLYYKFKHNQFLIEVLPFLLSFGADSSITTSISSLKMKLLEESVEIWNLLVKEYQYYGSSYVLADPEKEFIELLTQLGIELCFEGNYSAGVVHLQMASQKLQNMLDGYDRIYITSNNVVEDAIYRLGEISYNIGLCFFNEGDVIHADTTFQKSLHLLSSLPSLKSSKIIQSIAYFQPEILGFDRLGSAIPEVLSLTKRLKKKRVLAQEI
jgi:tetratricopeptide (TPR) repeat protein